MGENNTNQEVNFDEDMLFVQIDAFREKAKKLQMLINKKEEKVKELEALVREKEEKNLLLQEELNHKQAEADSLVADVETQVDRMMQTVKSNMDKLEERIDTQVSNNETQVQEQTAQMKETLENMTEGLESIRGELSEKVHAENVKVYRNIQDLIKELSSKEEDAKLQQETNAMLKKKIGLATGFGIINTILLLLLGLYQTGLLAVIIGLF